MRNHWQGFSFIEVMIILFVSGLLLVGALGNWQDFLNRQINQMHVNQIFHNLQFARLEAIQRHQPVFLCGTKDFVHCEENWSAGFMVFIRHQHNLEILRQERLEKKSIIHSGKLKLIQYGTLGQCLTRGTIHIMTSDQSAKIVLYDSGRARISK